MRQSDTILDGRADVEGIDEDRAAELARDAAEAARLASETAPTLTEIGQAEADRLRAQARSLRAGNIEAVIAWLENEAREIDLHLAQLRAELARPEGPAEAEAAAETPAPLPKN
jgi:hypothetical protein